MKIRHSDHLKTKNSKSKQHIAKKQTNNAQMIVLRNCTNEYFSLIVRKIKVKSKPDPINRYSHTLAFTPSSDRRAATFFFSLPCKSQQPV